MNEYVSLDVEMAWIDSEQDLMDLEVRILKDIFRGLEKDFAAELALWNATVPSDAEVERIPRVSHDRAREMIGSIGGHKVYDVNPEGERVLCDWAAKEHGVDAIFKYGCPPHGGFAIGLERLTQKVLGLANVKEACLFPRDRKRIRP